MRAVHPVKIAVTRFLDDLLKAECLEDIHAAAEACRSSLKPLVADGAVVTPWKSRCRPTDLYPDAENSTPRWIEDVLRKNGAPMSLSELSKKLPGLWAPSRDSGLMNLINRGIVTAYTIKRPGEPGRPLTMVGLVKA